MGDCRVIAVPPNIRTAITHSKLRPADLVGIQDTPGPGERRRSIRIQEAGRGQRIEPIMHFHMAVGEADLPRTPMNRRRNVPEKVVVTVRIGWNINSKGDAGDRTRSLLHENITTRGVVNLRQFVVPAYDPAITHAQVHAVTAHREKKLPPTGRRNGYCRQDTYRHRDC